MGSFMLQGFVLTLMFAIQKLSGNQDRYCKNYILNFKTCSVAVHDIYFYDDCYYKNYTFRSLLCKTKKRRQNDKHALRTSSDFYEIFLRNDRIKLPKTFQRSFWVLAFLVVCPSRVSINDVKMAHASSIIRFYTHIQFVRKEEPVKGWISTSTC